MIKTPHSIVGQPDERGSALIAVLLLLMLMSALAAALGVSGRTETLISRNQQSGAQAQAAAEAGINHAVELATRYIFQFKTNEFGTVEAAVNALLRGPDQATGTEDTDADNQSLGERTGIDAGEAIPLETDPDDRIDLGVNAQYTAFIMDDDDTAPDEDGDPFNDTNQTLIIRATGYGPDNTKVVLEALISPIPLPALVTNGDLDIGGNVTIDGTSGGVHSNGDLTIEGGSADLGGTVSTSGEYEGDDDYGAVEGAAEVPVPEVHASDYLVYADFIMTSSGTMTNSGGAVLCTWSKKTPCNNWDFNDSTLAWEIGSAAPSTGTYYVEGRVNVSGSPGSSKTPVQISIIAEGSINISGSPDFTADTPELLFVTDADLEISGGLDSGDPLTAAGQMLVHEQLNLTGNPELGGQLIVENATSVDDLVTTNNISGNVTITYNGGLGSGVYSVTGWRDIRQ